MIATRHPDPKDFYGALAVKSGGSLTIDSGATFGVAGTLDLNASIDQDVALTAAGEGINLAVTINHATAAAQGLDLSVAQLTTARTSGNVDGVAVALTSLAGDSGGSYSNLSLTVTDGGGSATHNAIKVGAGFDVLIDVSAAATGQADVVIGDNLASGFAIREDANNYLEINTANSGAKVDLGNTSTNPDVRVLGSGALSLKGGGDLLNDRFVQVVINATGASGGGTDGTLDLDVQTMEGSNVSRIKRVMIYAAITAPNREALKSTVTFSTATLGTIVATGNGYALVDTDATGNFACTVSDSADETVYLWCESAPGAASAGRGCVVVESIPDTAVWAA